MVYTSNPRQSLISASCRLTVAPGLWKNLFCLFVSVLSLDTVPGQFFSITRVCQNSVWLVFDPDPLVVRLFLSISPCSPRASSGSVQSNFPQEFSVFCCSNQLFGHFFASVWWLLKFVIGLFKQFSSFAWFFSFDFVFEPKSVGIMIHMLYLMATHSSQIINYSVEKSSRTFMQRKVYFM